MKTMIKSLCLVLVGAFVLQSTAMANNDKPITVNDLPVKAQQMIKKHFNGKKIVLVTVEKQVLKKSYDIVFASGAKAEIDKNGDWTEIDCKNDAVPSVFIPTQIHNYVNQNYVDSKIVRIEKDRSKYEVKLSNGIEITFNNKFQVVDINT